MTPTHPPAKPVRPRSQPLRLFCVEYTHAGTLYITVVEAVSEACALDQFTVEHPHAKVVRVY